MSTLLVCDPGLRGAGISYFNGPTLVRAYYARNPVEKGGGPLAWYSLAEAIYFDFKERGHRVDGYVCEIPQIYRYSPGDANDLIEITGVAAAVGASFPLAPNTAFCYRPREWKGQLKKEVHHPRIIEQLTPEELACTEEKRKTYAHNMWDAVGLGLFHLERTRVRMPKWVAK